MSLTNVGITQPWNEASISAGLEISTRGSIVHSRQVFTDTFGDASIDAKIGTITAGGGSVTEAGNKIAIDSTGGVSEAAAIYAAQKILLTSDDVRTFKYKWDYNTALLTNNPLLIQQYAGTPTDITNAARGAARVLQTHITNTNGFFVLYSDKAGVIKYWNQSTQGWQTTAISSATLSAGTTYIVVFEYTKDIWRFRLRNAGDAADIFTAPTWVSWDVTQDVGNDIYMIFGDVANDAFVSDMDLLEILAWDDGYLTSAQDIETDTFTMDEEFDSDEIFVKLGSTPLAATEIKVYVKQDGGAFGAAINVDVAPVAGETGWFAFAAGTTFSGHTTVTFKVELNSPDTDTRLEVITMKIKDITVAGGP